MKRTSRDLNDPSMTITQAVMTFGVRLVFDLFYVLAVSQNRGARWRSPAPSRSTGSAFTLRLRGRW